MAKKTKFYVIWEGNETGIFKTWKICQKHIKGYGGAKYKSFPSLREAEDAFAGSYFDAITPSKKKKIDLGLALHSSKECSVLYPLVPLSHHCVQN